MAILQRRIFYGKVGKGAELIEHVRRMDAIMTDHGVVNSMKVLSDFNSGRTDRTDRIVVEFRYDSLSDMESVETQMLTEPGSQKDFDEFVAGLGELIHHSEVEHWPLHS